MAKAHSALKTLGLGAAWAAAAAAIIGFFLPWAAMDVSGSTVSKTLHKTGLTEPLGYMTATVRHGTEEISGRLPSLSSIPSTVSGVQIPQLANDHDAKLAMALIEMLTGERQHLGLKSYAVYALPGLALLLAAVVTLVAASAAPIIVSGLSAAVAAVGSFKLATAPTETLLVAAKIGPGLWLSMVAYAVLAVAALLVWSGSRRTT